METSDVFDSEPLVPMDLRRGFWGALSGASGTPPRVVALTVQPTGTLIAKHQDLLIARLHREFTRSAR